VISVTRRRLGWVVFILGVFSFFAIVLSFSTNSIQDIKLTEQEIQSKIDAVLPLEKNGMVLSALRINLENNLVNVVATFEGERWGQEFNATIDMDGRPYYNNSAGTFHFLPEKIKVREVKFKGDTVSTKVQKFIDKYVDSPKINKNSNEIGKQIEEWVNVSIENTMAFVFKRIPIYTIPDTLKGNVASMFLKSVEIDQDSLTLKVSFWQFTKLLLFYIIIFIVALAVALVLLA